MKRRSAHFFSPPFVCSAPALRAIWLTRMSRLLLCGVLAMSACSANAQIAPKPLESSLLWKISGKSLKSASYLFGTMHLLCPEDLVLRRQVQEALQSAQQLVLEIDMDDPNLSKKMQRAMMNKVAADTSTLAGALGREEYEALEQFMRDSLSMNASVFKSFNPMLMEIMILPRLLDCVPASVEEELMRLAKKSSATKAIAGLETIEQQFAALEQVALKEQAAELVKLVKDFSGMRVKIKELAALYKAEDLAGLAKLLREMPGEMTETLVSVRNRAWIPAIEKLMKKKTNFIAVGAGHLPGEQGVISLLRKKGYTVEPVP
jgi:uncharacterized protein YbaP (TraB family)